MRQSQFEGQGLKCIARQNSRRLVPTAMYGRSPTPQIVVVHRRKIIVDQRIGVQRLDCGRRVQRLGRVDTMQRGALQNQVPAQALAAGHRVAHRLDQRLGWICRQGPLQAAGGKAGAFRQPVREGHSPSTRSAPLG